MTKKKVVNVSSASCEDVVVSQKAQITEMLERIKLIQDNLDTLGDVSLRLEAAIHDRGLQVLEEANEHHGMLMSQFRDLQTRLDKNLRQPVTKCQTRPSLWVRIKTWWQTWNRRRLQKKAEKIQRLLNEQAELK